MAAKEEDYLKIFATHNIPSTTPRPPVHSHPPKQNLITSHNTLTLEYKKTRKVKYKFKVLLTFAFCNEELESFIQL